MNQHLSDPKKRQYLNGRYVLLLILAFTGYRSLAQSPEITDTQSAGRCGPGVLELSATASEGALLRWYDSASGGNMIAIGDTTYTTPFLDATTSYYVAAGQMGTAGSNIPTPAPFTDTIPGTLFNSFAGSFGEEIHVMHPLRIDSVKVMVKNEVAGPASIQIRIKNIATDDEVMGPEYTFTASATLTEVSVPVNLEFEQGNYAVGMIYSGLSGGVYDTAGVSYPYTSPSGSVSITRMIAYNTPTFIFPFATSYYILYSGWSITDVVETPRVELTATISDSVTAAMDVASDEDVCTGDSVVMIAVADAGYHYLWQQVGIPDPAALDTNVYYATHSGDYNLVVTRGYCSDTSEKVTLEMLPAPEPVITASGNTLGTILSYETYQWIKEGADIPAATGTTYTVTEAGNYSVRVTNDNGCSGTSPEYVVDSAVTGIDDIPVNREAWQLYPNPAKESVHCQLPEGGSVEVYDINGKLKLRVSEELIDISKLAGGIYFVRLFDKSGNQVNAGKLIKE